MNPSNTHAATASLRPQRAFLLQAVSGLLTVFLAFPASALAQGTLIQFSVGLSSFTRYEVGADGTGLRTLPFPQSSANRISATTRSDYPGGRQYLYPANNNLMVWSEVSGQSKAVTNFQTPLSISLGSNLWSNDGRDSFVSFLLSGSTNQLLLYRAHVSGDDLASASYQPISSLNDPRLELVMEGSGAFYWWNHAGSGFYYLDPSDPTKVRFKTVGSGLTVGVDPIVFAAAVQLSELRVIPPVDPLNPVSDRYLVASTNAYAPGNGILAIDLATSTSWWLATQTPWTSSGIRGPCFSPDGSTIAFGNSRAVTTGTGKNKTTTYYGVYTVPFFGGPINRVTEVTGSGFVTVNNWNLP